MRNSNLAGRLEVFLASAVDAQPAEPNAPSLAAVAETPRRAPRRLTLTTRRIRIRDPGLRQFRVF